MKTICVSSKQCKAPSRTFFNFNIESNDYLCEMNASTADLTENQYLNLQLYVPSMAAKVNKGIEENRG